MVHVTPRRGLTGIAAGCLLVGSIAAVTAAPRGAAQPLATPTGTALVFETGAPQSVPTATAAPAASATVVQPATSGPPPAGPHTASPTATRPAHHHPSTPTATPTSTRVPLVIPTSQAVTLPSATPPAVPTPASYGALDHAILYDDGVQMAILPQGSGAPAGLNALSVGSGLRPRFSGQWQYIYYNHGFWLGDIYGHQRPLVPPTLPGEQVYDAIPSPDGQYIAWQMVTPATIDGNLVNTGASRIVLTDDAGSDARTLLQDSAGSTYGNIPLIYGWRPGSPPTLLVQTNYAIPSMLGLHKGLEEFDPVTRDLVNDYLPPLGEGTLPQGEVLGVSGSGAYMAYAAQDAHLPSGEGPFPVDLRVMSLANRHSVLIDTASQHHDGPAGKLPAPRAYIFSRQAFFSPDDRHIAYTRLDILYRKGALHPYVRPIACIANVDGSGQHDLAADEEVVGWIDANTVLVHRVHTLTDGLYALDLTTNTAHRLLLGSGLAVDGIVP